MNTVGVQLGEAVFMGGRDKPGHDVQKRRVG
jgi:hypothetical protein